MEKDSTIGENIDEDNNSINMLTNIGYLLKIMKYFTFIFNFSFFTGIIWMVACDILNEKYLQTQDDPGDSFTQKFEIENESDSKKVLITMYFLFTSLTTTGFGDLHPRSNSERMLSTIMLLIGVSIVSYAMTVFIDILRNYRSIYDNIDDGDNLSKFFGMMARFNNGKKVDTNLKNKIEAYFEYRWKHDKNQAVDEEDEKSMLYQMPFEVQNKLFSGFLH